MRLQILILLALLLFLLAILGFAPVHVPINDKFLHTLAFATTALILYHLWDLGLGRNSILTSSVMLVLSVGSELIQGFLPYRTFDTNDILANLAGSLLGIGMGIGVEAGRWWWQEHRHRRRRSGGGGSTSAGSQVRYVELSSESDVLEMV